jgi:uncharacterized RDD family membrane protein YckC
MNTSLLQRLGFLFTLLCLTAVATHPGAAAAAGAHSATATTSAPSTATPSTAAPTQEDHSSASPPPASDDAFDDDSDRGDRSDWRSRIEQHRRHNSRHHEDGDVVSIGHSSHLESGQKADSVVSVFGSSTSDGEAVDVVSVFGNTRVTGPVGDTAVAVLGSTYVDAKVNGDVVAVLGNVELGPNAEVGGDVVAVMGTVKRDPGAVVHGSVQRVIDWDFGDGSGFSGLNTWITHCLLLGRPLAFAAGLGWAWTLALGLLAFYACLALMFRQGIDQCVHTLESQPGHTALASLLGILLTPVLLVLLCVTVIGIAAVPFVVAALFCMSLFGKAVMLAWLGGRISGRRPSPAGSPAWGHPAVAVLIGGAIVLVLYVVPIVGFLVYKLLGFFGFGAVLYTLVLRVRARRANGTPPPPFAAANPGSANSPPSGNAASMAGPGWTAAAPAAGPAAAPAAPNAATEPFASAPPPFASPPSPAPPAAPASVSPQITAALPRAGFWVRMGALFLDVLLVGFAMSLLHPFGDFHIVVLAVYGAVMWKLRGTTVGGIVFDLHVVRLDGRPLDWETAIVRALGCFLSLFVVFLGFIWIAFDDNHQAWHDKIAGTVVVRAKRGGI